MTSLPRPHRCIALALALLAVVWTAGSLRAEPHTASYHLVTVVDGLDHPWCLAFLPDGALLVTERAGRLRVVRDGVLDPAPVAGVPPVYARSQGGLFDVLPHPDFATNRLIYLSYAHGTPQANSTRVARARLDAEGDGAALTGLDVVFETVPDKDTPVHYGGRMVFLPDRTLLVTTGDGFDYREAAQRLDNLLGKIVRINADGTVPDDNPFVDRPDARPEIWTYGHRNPQGIVHDPVSGRVYMHEHGPRGGDELNIVVEGRNYGWPAISYGLDYSGAVITPYTELPGMEQPVVQWTPSIAPAGLALYAGAAFPDWSGDLLVAALADRNVYRVDLEGGAVVGQQTLFDEADARIRDVRVGPDGYVYLLTDERDGRVLKVAPGPAS